MLSSSLALARRVHITRTSQVYYLGWAALAILSLINYSLGGYAGLTFTNPDYSIVAVTVLISISLLFYGIFGRNSRVGEMIRYLALWLAIFPVGRAFTYVMASLNFPLIDRELDQFDKALGFDWLNWFHFVNAHSDVKVVLVAAYISVALQIHFSIIYFSHREEGNRSNELCWAAIIALFITAIVSGILPAMGTFEYYGVADAQHGGHLHDLHALRDGTLTSVSLNDIKGIVTLPSYHTVLAILLTYAYRSQPRMLAVVLPLNLLMLVAIPSEGGHYLADMLAGGAVAALSIWIVERTALGKRST
jgi:PAP2 superfamily